MKRPRFEIVRSDAGWHARFIAANGRIVWTTEVYERERAARRAIELLTGLSTVDTTFTLVTTGLPEYAATQTYSPSQKVEVREVDERDPNRCPDCGHPWAKHDRDFGCLTHDHGRGGYCDCQRLGDGGVA